MDAIPASLTAAYTQATADVRRLDPDRFFASLFIPEPARLQVHAVLAFSAEIARVRDVVSSPLPGEIRLQWWRDLLSDLKLADAGAPPLAQALADTIIRCRLPVDAFQNLIDARIFDLYDDPMPSQNDLDGYLGETASALFRLSSLILADGGEAGAADLAGHAGVAYGLTGLLRALPFHASKGQIYLPADLLARHGVAPSDITDGKATPGLLAALAELRVLARDHHARALKLLKDAPTSVRPAFLPLALVPALLKIMDRSDYDPYRTPVEVAQWKRQFSLWWTARRL